MRRGDRGYVLVLRVSPNPASTFARTGLTLSFYKQGGGGYHGSRERELHHVQRKISKKIEVAVQCPVAIVRRLEIAEDVLGKASALAVEKTERWDREKHREKNEVQAQKDRAKEAN